MNNEIIMFIIWLVLLSTMGLVVFLFYKILDQLVKNKIKYAVWNFIYIILLASFAASFPSIVKKRYQQETSDIAITNSITWEQRMATNIHFKGKLPEK